MASRELVARTSAIALALCALLVALVARRGDVYSGGGADLSGTLCVLLSPGRGILAADESIATISRRFDAVGLGNDDEKRRAWRSHVISTAAELSSVLSGVIFEESGMGIMQPVAGGGQRRMVEQLTSRGVHVGIK